MKITIDIAKPTEVKVVADGARKSANYDLLERESQMLVCRALEEARYSCSMRLRSECEKSKETE